MTGPTIGDRYRLARRLGQGGMSRVYLCWDERLHLWCSIKVMAAEVVDDAVLRARFVQEARTLARLGHENLVRLYELVDHVACPYMVMEYVEGGTLAERMARGPLHLHHAITLVAQTCSALHAAHQAGVIHRDIKPQNLLLAADGTLKVGDFGVARVQQEMRLTMSNMSLGTLAYMPPEQQRDASQVDHRADIYGAGATLFALSTGRRPTALLTQDREETLGLVPAEIRPIVRRATERGRTDRYESAVAMEQALRAALARVPLPPDAPALVDRVESPPDGPPTSSEVVLEPGELEGTDESWGGMARPTLDRTLSPFESIDPSRNSIPPATQIHALPPKRSRVRRLVTGALIVLLGIGCGGGCAGVALVGLGSVGTVLAWPPGF